VTPDERRRSLDELGNEIARCTKCRLHESRTQAVPGEGHPETEVVFVGEGPGFNEDQQGRPFVGAAGGLLNELLKSVGWSRQEVFITNVVKCRPPGNRDPEPDEIAACRPYLHRQLELLDPAVLVTLGRISTGSLLPGARISSSHGTMRPLEPETGAPDALAYPMYHPAAAFRQPALRETLQADIAGLPDALIESRRRRHEKRGAVALPGGGAAQPVPVESGVMPAAAGTSPADPVTTPVESSNRPVESRIAPGVNPETSDTADQMSMF
jgi:uracil-DNA glycosylase